MIDSWLIVFVVFLSLVGALTCIHIIFTWVNERFDLMWWTRYLKK